MIDPRLAVAAIALVLIGILIALITSILQVLRNDIGYRFQTYTGLLVVLVGLGIFAVSLHRIIMVALPAAAFVLLTGIVESARARERRQPRQ